MEKTECGSDPQKKQKKKMVNSVSKTTDLPSCFQSAVRSLNNFYYNELYKFLNENDLLS